MHFRSLCLALGLVLPACTAPRTSTEPLPADDLKGIERDVAEMLESIRRLETRLGHLETQLSAANPEEEFTMLTIDATGDHAAFPGLTGFDSSNSVLCHVLEWRGFGKMKRFTQLADSRFFLEAPGSPTIVATSGVGGISNSDGSTRYVILTLDGRLKPGVQYQLRPRNENDTYKWSVAEGMTIAAN